jgi:hypothetical protein
MTTTKNAPWHDLQVMIQDLHIDRAFRLRPIRDRQQKVRRPCNACGDRYEDWGHLIPERPYCWQRRCKWGLN